MAYSPTVPSEKVTLVHSKSSVHAPSRGQQRNPLPVVKKSEQIDIAKLDDIDEAFVCIVNYGAAIEGDDVTYAEEGGRIEVKRATAVTIWKYSQTHQMKVTCTAYVQSRIRVESSLLRTKAEL